MLALGRQGECPTKVKNATQRNAPWIKFHAFRLYVFVTYIPYEKQNFCAVYENIIPSFVKRVIKTHCSLLKLSGPDVSC